MEKNVSAISAEISAACDRAGRDVSDVTLVAVSKTVGLEEVKAAISAGIHDFGENRTVLFKEKQAAFPGESWHFIGSIQTNKIKDFVGRAALVHSVASERALIAIAKRAEAAGLVQSVLLEVNMSGEASKDGFAAGDLDAALEAACALGGVRVEGLMTMAARENPTAARKSFAGLRELRDRYRNMYKSAKNIRLIELSMGMSDDYGIAIEEGATIVRIGRSIWL
ncbi:MAG TPA: YggS family pyridoxal phosphate-dependent enzyme [Coriobacteriia bacterium]|nr:YggS family pyridoxal phosphate-dependent enzyme [Coriobacteriia bacterium]